MSIGKDVNDPLGLYKTEGVEGDAILCRRLTVRVDMYSGPSPDLIVHHGYRNLAVSRSALHAHLNLLGDQTSLLTVEIIPGSLFSSSRSLSWPFRDASSVSFIENFCFLFLCVIEVLGRSEMLWSLFTLSTSCNFIVSY